MIRSETKIKLKSKDVRMHFFLFACKRMLQFMWFLIQKKDVYFKQFFLGLSASTRRMYREIKTCRGIATMSENAKQK